MELYSTPIRIQEVELSNIVSVPSTFYTEESGEIKATTDLSS
jgi:hypothetical protein